MSSATHTMRRAWLIMLMQKGWWTLEQLNLELHKHHPTLPAVEASTLNTLVDENRLTVRYPRTEFNSATYGLLPSNVALRTISLGDLGLFDE
jgi:hypothetical protein